MAEQEDYSGQFYGEANIRIKDLEEKQNMLKDRLLLIGENFIEIRDELDGKVIELKKEMNNLKQEMERIKSFLEIFSTQMSKFAKKEDLEILTKQAKMFQPLEFVRKSELKNLNQ